MISRAGYIIVLISFLSLTTLTVSCRQHRTPKSITFKRVSKSDDNLSDKEKNFTRETSQVKKGSTESLFTQYIPAPLSGFPEQIICRKAYFSSYNKDTKLPNWVAWRLTSEHTDGVYKRINIYLEDSNVPTPRATEDDYQSSGWSHGHMCPAGDNKWDEIAMRESNLLTNICPQHASLNSGLWNVIERKCRKWAQEYGDLFIVCGPILLNKEHETIGKNKVVVPEAFFKVILRLNPQPTAIAFVVRNNEGKKKKDQYVNTIDDVERITGIDFFPTLPDSIENEVEAYANLDDW
jgi:endonuclease G